MMIYVLWILLVVCFIAMFPLAWAFIQEQLTGPKELKLLRQSAQQEFQDLQYQRKTQLGEARFLIDTNYIQRHKIANYANLILGSSVIVAIPLIAIWSCVKTHTQIPLWLILLSSIFFLIAAMFFLSGFNYQQKHDRLLESALVSGGIGLKVSEEGLYISVATLHANLKSLIEKGQTGILLKWPEILEIETRQMSHGRTLVWYLVVKTKTEKNPYLIKFISLAASQEEITDSIQKLQPSFSASTSLRC